MTIGGRTWRTGDVITIDGAAGEVFDGPVAMRQPELTGDFGVLMGWADGVRRMKVRANPETPGTRAPPGSSGPRGSGSAAPSICSLKASGFWQSGR